MRRLGARDRRAIRIGVALTVPLILAIFVIRPMGHARDDLRDALDRERELLARELAMLAAGGRLHKALGDRGAHVRAARNATFDGPAPMASASLTRQVADIAEESGLAVRSASSRGVSEGGTPLQVVEMDIAAVGDWSSVTRFLAALPEPSKYLGVSSFSLSRDGTTLHGQAALQLDARIVGLVSPAFDAPALSRGGTQ